MIRLAASPILLLLVAGCATTGSGAPERAAPVPIP